LSYVVRNADPHAKNIALYYGTREDVAYTPVYDVVTTQAYPRFATNAPGLAVGGRKTWAPGQTLEPFFKAQLGIAPSQYKAMVEQLCESAAEVGREVIEAAKHEPRWHNVAKGMVHVWNEGMASLRSVRREKHLKGLTAQSTPRRN
jgi:serine/threonine-protein kinase HipA